MAEATIITAASRVGTGLRIERYLYVTSERFPFCGKEANMLIADMLAPILMLWTLVA